MKVKLESFSDDRLILVFRKLMALDLPISIAFKISKIIPKIEDTAKRYNDLKIKLFQKYGSQQDDKVVINNDKVDLFMNEINSLNMEEEDFDFKQISIKDLGDVKMTIEEVLVLRKFGLFSDDN